MYVQTNMLLLQEYVLVTNNYKQFKRLYITVEFYIHEKPEV